MLVDDDRSVLEALGELLRDENFTVVLASGGAKACDEFQSRDVDVAILDLNLGRGEDGLQVCRRLREMRPGLPVLFITARPERLTMPLGGRTALMKKPLNLPRLMYVLDKWMEEERTEADVHNRSQIL